MTHDQIIEVIHAIGEAAIPVAIGVAVVVMMVTYAFMIVDMSGFRDKGR